MSRKKIFLFPLFAVLSIQLGCSQQPSVSKMSEDELTAYAREVHARVLTIDTHDDISFDFATEKDDPGNPDNRRQVTLPKMKQGGLDVGFFIVYVGQGERTPEGYEFAYKQAVTKFDAIHRMTEKMHPDKIELAYTPDDVVRIHRSGKLVACIGIENGWPIGKDLTKVKEFYDRGGRYITLAHGGHNDICDSATPRQGEPEAEHNGVSEFGKQVIAEMNRWGIMVDISHISKKSALDALKLSKAPVIASHSGARAVNDHPRNIDDETLLELKNNGGVIQLVALRDFVKTRRPSPERLQAIAALRKEYGLPEQGGFGAIGRLMESWPEERRAAFRERMQEIDQKHPLPPVTVQDFVNHIDHVVRLIGIDHAGISSDFDGGGGVDGWNDASETPNVTKELIRRGYTEDQIQKLWGSNLLRVWREVERVAAELQKQSPVGSK
ncbi:MAG TPA: dipeptidase [Bacteroidota bacterium]|nr:dipeptidase [Bacteroidota bacterium]